MKTYLVTLRNRGVPADSIAYNVAHHGTLEAPADDGSDDTGAAEV